MEKVVRSRFVRRGRALSFRVDEVELPGGARTRRFVVDHPGSVAILPFLPDGGLLLIRQYRHPLGAELLEIPAGTLKEGEEPVDCAKRELREETGYEAESMEELLRCYLAPGYSGELMQIFVARGLKEAEAEAEADEAIRVERVELDEAVRLIAENTIEDAKTIAGILAYHLRELQPSQKGRRAGHTSNGGR